MIQLATKSTNCLHMNQTVIDLICDLIVFMYEDNHHYESMCHWIPILYDEDGDRIIDNWTQDNLNQMLQDRLMVSNENKHNFR